MEAKNRNLVPYMLPAAVAFAVGYSLYEQRLGDDWAVETRNESRPLGDRRRESHQGHARPKLTAEPRNSSIFVTVSKMRERMQPAGNLRIVDARDQDAYDRGHIPSAVRLPLDAWAEQALLSGGLLDAERWSRLVGSLGIDSSSEVIVYHNAFSDVSAPYWTFRYVGVDRVAILRGGWQAWERECVIASTASPRPAPVSFEPDFYSDSLLEAAKSRWQALTHARDRAESRSFAPPSEPSPTGFEL